MGLTKILLAAVFVLVPCFLFCACGSSTASSAQSSSGLVANIPVNRDGAVSLEVSNGIGADIRVSVWDRSLARVIVSRADETAAKLELVKVTNAGAAKFRVIISPNSKRSFIDSILFRVPQTIIEVRIPREVSLFIATSNGPTDVKGVIGPIRITSENGPITISHAGSVINVDSQNGPIFASVVDMGRQPNIRLSLIDGPVELDVPPNFRADIQTRHVFGPTDVASSIHSGPGTVSLSNVAGPIDVVQVTTAGHDSPQY
jgi:hypothetical protein